MNDHETLQESIAKLNLPPGIDPNKIPPLPWDNNIDINK